MFFDTHIHLDDKQFDMDRDEVLRQAQEAGITLMLNAAIDLPTCYSTVAMTAAYPPLYGAVGIHPHSVTAMQDADLDVLRTLTREPKIKAIGEVGLDYYYDFAPRDVQKARLRDQLTLARKCALPVIIHDREAHDDCLSILRDFTDLKVVYHCYSGSLEYAKILIGMGFYLSFTGALTFRNAKAAPSVVEWMPRDRIMIETDCPYLTPVPYRGERNTPAHVVSVAEKIAELWGVSIQEVARITSDNGQRFFKII